MSTFSWKPYEPTLHRLMGLGAGILNLGLLLDRRERRQLPPENDRYPVIWVSNSGPGPRYEREEFENSDAYWAKARVMDTLDDIRDFARGQTAAWFVVLGIGILLGRAIG